MSGTDFVFDKFSRTCDICGTPRKASELRVRDGIAICSRHPGFRTTIELDRLNAHRRVPISPLRKGTRPFAPLPTWEAEEGKILDLITSVAPFETFDTTSDGSPGITGTQSFRAAGWSIVYLAAIVTEAKRPAAWLAQAKAKAIALGDYLISRQIGNGTDLTLTAANNVQFGAFSLTGASNERETSGDAGIACAALGRLYQVTGILKYLQAAQNAANFIVNMQAGNLCATRPSSLSASGAGYFFGPVTHMIDMGDTSDMDHLYYPSDLVCLWALSLLKTIAGDGTYGASTTVSYFTAAPARLLSVSIAQMRTFWETGVANTGSTAIVNGFSAATPRERFNAFPVNKLGGNINGTGSWENQDGLGGSLVTAQNWAEGMYAMFQVDGASASMTALWTYLQTFVDSGTYVLASTVPTRIALRGTLGPFNAKNAPTTLFDVSAKNGSSFYDWSAAGLMAGLANVASLDATKEAIGQPRARVAEGSFRDGRTQYLGRLGVSGLSFQPWSDATHRQESVTRAAQAGLMYRQRQAFMGTH